MKLTRIILENFGVYTRQRFDFDDAPLILVYGPNESGKTTALNGLRGALFGFPHRSVYLTGKTMTAEVFATMADGSALQFARKKGKKDDINGKLGGRRLSADELPKLLGDIDFDSYQQLFGFTLDELRAGESALKNAKLSEALAGGGLGGVNILQTLRTDLTNSLTGLYRARGGSQIATLLADIRARQEQLKNVQTLPMAIEDLRGKLRDANQRSENAKAQFAERHQLVSRIEKLQQAYPQLRALRKIESTISSIPVPLGLDATFISQWSDYIQQQSKLRETVESESTQLDKDQHKIAQLSASHAGTGFETQVELLGHQAKEVPELRQRLKELENVRHDSTSAVERLLGVLGLEQVDEAVLALNISAPQRESLEQAADSYERLGKEILPLAAKLEAAQEQLAQLSPEKTKSVVPENLDELSALVAKLEQEELSQAELVEAVCELCESPEFEVLGGRLRARILDCPPLDYTWPVLSSQEVAKHIRLLEDSQRAQAQLARDSKRIENDLLRLQRELSELQTSQAAAPLTELELVANQRNRLIRDWLDELTEPLLAGSIGTAQQQLRLQQLDLLHQRSDGLLAKLIETAELLAKSSQLQKQVQSLTHQLEQQRAEMEREVAQSQLFNALWSEAWQACPFQPLSPDAMSSWVQDFESWSRTAAELDIQRRKLVTCRATVKQLRGDLMDRWPTVINLEVSCQWLKSQIVDWLDSTRDSQQEQLRYETARANLAEFQSRLEELSEQHSRALAEYQNWLKSTPLPQQWPVNQLKTLLDSVEQLKREQAVAVRASEQLREVQTRLSGFEQAVEELRSNLGEAASSAPTELVAQQWLSALQKSRNEASERAKLMATIEHRQNRLRECSTRLADIDQRLAALSTNVVQEGATDATAFALLMQQAQQVAQLRSEQNELRSSLQMAAGKENVDEFLADLDATDESALALQASEAKRDLEKTEKQRQEADQEIGALANQLNQLAQSEVAQRAEQQLRELRGQLAVLCEQWVVQRLAQELLNRSMERFAHDHEPALLSLTRKYFAKLTDNRYSTVEHDTATGKFHVRSSRGEAFEPDRLSTGTREQLYLAIRMAYIAYYSEHHEPLPILMDDCFVNFDDARSKFALQALLEWQDNLQTILLSCHWRLVQQLAEIAPETPVIHLGKQVTSTARELQQELAIS